MPTTYTYEGTGKTQPKLQLTYFTFTGRGEPVRQALIIGGLAFEDEQLAFPEWFGGRKAASKFGALPYLTVDGEVLAQTIAIMVYVGQLGGLAPPASEPLKLARINETMHLIEDLAKHLGPAYVAARSTGPEEEKAAAREKVAEELVKGFPNLEKQLESNNGGNGYIVGDSLTVADLYVVTQIDWFINGIPQIPAAISIDKFPKLVAYIERINNDPKLQEYKSKKQH
jgi:glutathione S-transferase